jgi:RNA polymerase sigma-70 factor (ECF subfamily)
VGDVKKKKPEPIPELDERGFMKEFKDLERAYRATHKRLRAALVATGEDGTHPDENIIRGAISDVNFAINWMQTGKRPGSKRGIERRSAYQRTQLLSPLIMQSYKNSYSSRSSSTLTPDQLFKLEQALQMLSPQEREAYELAHGKGFTQEEVAGFLGMTRGSVKKLIERAQKKVSGELEGNLFLMD